MMPSTLSVSYQQKLIKYVFEHGNAASLDFLRDTVYKAIICGLYIHYKDFKCVQVHMSWQ